jgi:hypothetical protein
LRATSSRKCSLTCRNAGYRLLTDATQDPLELANQHHGLVVHGRGADHQVDVLGELLWIPAFTYPLRLMPEAKCRKGKTEIGTDGRRPPRHQSEQHAQSGGHRPAARPPRPKYSYVGAIFSASGFSAPAANFALAHSVSLVDVRAPQFQELVQAARECGAALSAYYREQPGTDQVRLDAVTDSRHDDSPAICPGWEYPHASLQRC